MITVYQNGELHFQNKIYKCALGRNGIKKKILGGDGCTPYIHEAKVGENGRSARHALAVRM